MEMLKPATIGRHNIPLPMLQYADDTIFIAEGSRFNASAIRRLLANFELISGLSVNLDKSWAFGVNIDSEEMAGIADELSCKVGELPIPYLGMKIGGRILGLKGGMIWWRR